MSPSNEVIDRIDERWGELNTLVDSLRPEELVKPTADGWAVKDHLVHIAAWEHSLLALLDGTDRREAMGVGRDAGDTDAINAEVWAMHREKTPEQALDYFRRTHELLMKRLQALTDADLQLTYNHYQPNEPRDVDDDRPVIDWVAGNTYDHYAEHIAWINQLIESSAAR